MSTRADTGVTVVVPTYNRPTSLARLLRALSAQHTPPDEIVIVDAGRNSGDSTEWRRLAYPISLRYVRANVRSVCVQRNLGIRMAGTPLIWFCDDDVEPAGDYLTRILRHFADHRLCGAATGLISERTPGGQWVSIPRAPSTAAMVWATVFFHPVFACSDSDGLGPIRRRLLTKGNGLTAAGWPLLTDFSGTVIRVRSYGLGAAVVRRSWLGADPFDEILDPSGVGDNYGVALSFPASEGIHLVRDAVVRHHREPSNRPSENLAYFRRIMALHYFQSGPKKGRIVRQMTLAWSVLGSWAQQRMRGERAKAQASLHALWRIVRGSNPYLTAIRRGHRGPVELTAPL